MRAVGLITEYNPFHNGHRHHLRASLEAARADVAVAVMSGHFLQRGEPALVDKWLRAEMALRCGIDLVIELPFPFACGSAPHFALGAVRCLDALGVSSLCFGSESGALENLERVARMLDQHRVQVADETAALLRQGVHFAAARGHAYAGLSGDDAACRVLAQPNNILGIEYLRALRATGSSIRPLTISRIGSGYHDEAVGEGNVASATGIRQRLSAGKKVDGLLPQASGDILRQALGKGLSPDDDLLHRLLMAQIFRGRDYLRTLYQVESGLEARLAEAAVSSADMQALVEAVKVRQFTRTRIQRILMYVLNDVRADLMEEMLAAGPFYLRLLGSSSRGRAFLGAARKRRKLPLLTNLSRVFAQLRRAYGVDAERYRLARAMFDLDVRATCNYSLLLPGWSRANRNRDFYEAPLAVDAKIR